MRTSAWSRCSRRPGSDGIDNSCRLLFSSEGKKGRVLLAVVLHEKHTQRTPPRVIVLVRRRRDRWRANRNPERSALEERFCS